MFTEHQPRIQEYAAHSPQNFAEVAVFVIETARVPLQRAVEAHRNHMLQDRWDHLWAWKHEAVRQLWERAEARKARLDALYPDRNAMLYEVALWEGFGLEKGGFLLQLAYGLSGCLDTHNKERLGLPRRKFDAWRFTRSSIEKRVELVDEYHRTVDEAGGTAVLWDDWCSWIFMNNPKTWRDSDQVSEYHCMAFGPQAMPEDEIPF